MKTQRWLLLLVVTVLLSGFPLASASAEGWSKPTKPGWKDGEAKNGWIVSKIQHMTLKEKVGQLFMIQIYGQTPRDPNYEQTNLDENRGGKNFAEIINKYHIGGVIYYNWNGNIGMPLDAKQVQSLSNGVQNIAMDQRMPIPMLIATDQEGGIVARVRKPATEFPGNMALGATRSAEYAKESAEIMGSEIRALGINMDLAPDFDVNVNPKNPVIGVRSFSENPDLVSELGVAQVEGYQGQKVIATAKHFPGHGDTDVDSHFGLPIIHHDWETLWNVDLKPFRAGIQAGIGAIMTAHIVVPALDDSGLPATLSKPIMTGLLRDKLGYNGLVITDALGMSGANVLPPDEVPVKAFQAGADILLNPPDFPLAYNAVLDAVKNGEISKKRLDESVYRILSAKMKMGLFKNPYISTEALAQIGSPEHLAAAEEMTNKSITLVKNNNHILPLQKGQKVAVMGPYGGKPDMLASLLQGKGVQASSFSTYTSPTDQQIKEAVSRSADADVILVTAYTANTNEAQQKLVQSLLATGKPVVVASMRNPYDLSVFPDIDANILTYGNEDVSVKALARALVGEINPSGKLPVTIPGQRDYGYGLSY
ncbi:MAG TPA: glycoside hydrolase family 3 protein [Bacillales bacterium]|nr:glycoside hydrolase family 3 protein [Bacillales bacterium]